MAEIYALIGDVEGRKLDEQQLSCIGKNVYNHLVIAGAGTGKTTTIVGKIKYILARNLYKFDEILVLSFTNASAAEMRQRIHKETGQPIEALTFHKLGLNIIKTAANQRGAKPPKITKLDLPKFIKQALPTSDEAFVELTETVINLIKSGGHNFGEIIKKLPPESRDQKILHKIQPIYTAYQDKLCQNNEIDFNDMINLATKLVEQGKYQHSYKCVIVDEYQDISKARFRLLQAMRRQSHYDLFAVGDDWQSIYRFAGSDIGFILNFEKYWGKTTISKIETTYRSPQGLVDIAGKFIMKNPNQVKKAIKSHSRNRGFPLTEINAAGDWRMLIGLMEALIKLPQGSSVYLIGRYNFDIKMVKNDRFFICKINQIGAEIVFKSRPDLKIAFITAHKSKGLEADFVFIINNKNATVGFPSQIAGEPILEALLENSDNFADSEERRLFYVAFTRARQQVYLLTPQKQESKFVLELRKHYGSRMEPN